MTIEQIIEYIILILPQIIQIVTVIALFMRRAAEMTNLNKKVTDLKCVDELKAEVRDMQSQIKQLLDELYDAKKLNKELLTKIDRIERK